MCNWIKKHKTSILIAIFVILTILVFIVVLILVNEAYEKKEGYIIAWDGKDVLAYVGSVASAAGTIILGIIAWQQNARLLKLEEGAFLASNGVSALLTEVTVTGIKQKAVNLDLHEEQILSVEDFDEKTYWQDGGSIIFTCKIKPLNETIHTALVHVKQLEMFCSKDKNKFIDAHFSVTNIDLANTYSRVAISRDFDQFQVTVLISGTEKDKLISVLSCANSEIFINMTLSLLSDKFVAVELKCRATLKDPDYDEEEGVYTHFKTGEKDAPICFWNDTSLIRKQDIIIKSVMEDTDNGQA